MCIGSLRDVVAYPFLPRFASRNSTCLRTATLSALVHLIVYVESSRSMGRDALQFGYQGSGTESTMRYSGGRGERMRRTNWVVFEHAQRLMRSWPLHCSVVARHGHRYEAHHDGT
jgi:hypothetical protein